MAKRKRRKSTLRKNFLKGRKTMRRKNISRRKNNIRIKKTMRRKTNIRKKNTMRKNKNMIMIGGTPFTFKPATADSRAVKSLNLLEIGEGDGIINTLNIDVKPGEYNWEESLLSPEGVPSDQAGIYYHKVEVTLIKTGIKFHIYRRYSEFKKLHEELMVYGFYAYELPGKILFKTPKKLEKRSQELKIYIDRLLSKLDVDKERLTSINEKGEKVWMDRKSTSVDAEITKLINCFERIKSFICGDNLYDNALLSQTLPT